MKSDDEEISWTTTLRYFPSIRISVSNLHISRRNHTQKLFKNCNNNFRGFCAWCVYETKRVLKTTFPRYFSSNPPQPHGVKQQHLYVQSIGSPLSLTMIVRHIFIKFLISFSFAIHVKVQLNVTFVHVNSC